jgi:hypothetical protein
MTVVTCMILRDLITPDDPRPTAYNSWTSLPPRLCMLHGSWWPLADWMACRPAGHPSPPHLHALTTTVMVGKLPTLGRVHRRASIIQYFYALFCYFYWLFSVNKQKLVEEHGQQYPLPCYRPDISLSEATATSAPNNSYLTEEIGISPSFLLLF